MMTNVSFVVSRTSCDGEDFSQDRPGIDTDSDMITCEMRDFVGHWRSLPVKLVNTGQTITSLNVPESIVIFHGYCDGRDTVKEVGHEFKFLVLCDKNDGEMITPSFFQTLFDRHILVVRPACKITSNQVEEAIKQKKTEAYKSFFEFNGRKYDDRLKGNLDPRNFAEAGWRYEQSCKIECSYTTPSNSHSRIDICKDEDAFITGGVDSGSKEPFSRFTKVENLENLHPFHFAGDFFCKKNFERNMLQKMPLLVNSEGDDVSGSLYQLCGSRYFRCSKAFILSHRNSPIQQLEREEKRQVLREVRLNRLMEELKLLRERGREDTKVYSDKLKDLIFLTHFDTLLQETENNFVNYVAQLCDKSDVIAEADKPALSEIKASLSGINLEQLKQYVSPLIDALAKYEITLTKFMKLKGMDEDTLNAGVEVRTQKAREEFTRSLASFLEQPFINERVAGYLEKGDFASKFVNLISNDTAERIEALRPLSKAGNDLQAALAGLQSKVSQLTLSCIAMKLIDLPEETPSQSIEAMDGEPGPSSSVTDSASVA